MIEKTQILDLLRAGVKPALGCTEPVAVAIAVSRAYAEVKGELKDTKIMISPSIYKNGMRVGIPGTPSAGLVPASALAIVCGDYTKGLEVFADIDEASIKAADKLIAAGLIHVYPEMKPPVSFYISAEITTDKGVGYCEVTGGHTNISLVKKDGKVVYSQEKTSASSASTAPKLIALRDHTIQEIIESVKAIPGEELAFMQDGIDMNLAIANAGLTQYDHTKNLGAQITKLMDEGLLAKDLPTRARAMAAAASDARMSGIKMSVMSSAGSGNHGVTAILPVYLTAQDVGASKEDTWRAVAISHLTTRLIKESTGSLSPICGCAVAAGCGAAVASAWLMGATYEQIGGALMNMIANLAGLVCDGAKRGCALKVAGAASEAIVAAKLAKDGFIVPGMDGILGNDAELSAKNLGRLCDEAMQPMDPKIIEIMVATEEHYCS